MKFRRQHRFGPFVVDFCCPRIGLVIEIDGPTHEVRRDADEERTRFLAARGLRVLRFSDDDVREDIDAVLREIRTAIAPFFAA